MNFTSLCGRMTEYKTLQYSFLSLHGTSAVLAIFGNSLVLVSIWRTARLHTPPNVLLAGLALSDLGVGGITQPARILQETANMKADCAMYKRSYSVMISSSRVFVAVSFVTLTSISVDRFLALRLHLRYQELVTFQRTAAVLTFIWSACIAVLVWAKLDVISATIFSHFIMLVCVFLTLLCYFRILKIVRRHHLQIQSQAISSLNVGQTLLNMARYQKSVFNMLYIVGFFMFSYFPWVVVVPVFFAVGKAVTTAIYICQTLLFLNSCLNPVLYCWRMREIRQSVKETLLTIFAYVIRCKNT